MVPIEGYGNITITVNMPNGLLEVRLVDTAYIPVFHMTVASLNKFVKKGVYLDTENNCLQQNGKMFCMLEQYYNQWTLEFHELPSIFTMTEADSNGPTTKNIWYHCLGHIGPDAVQHLPGLKDDSTQAPKMIDCKACSLSKAHQIISQQPQA